jgi:hypothetical protein
MTRERIITGLAFSLAAAILFVGACANPGTDTGNPTTVGVKVVGITQGALAKFSKAQNSGDLNLTEARIVLKEIQLEPLAVSCASDEVEPSPEPPDLEFDFPGPVVVDLLNNSSLPEIGTVQTLSGIYCEIEIKFDKLEPGAVPEIPADDPLVNNAMIIRGTRGDGTPFLVRLTEDDRFKIEGSQANGFEIADSNGLEQFFVSLSRNTWFEGVDLNTAEVSGDGTIVLDEANNVALWAGVVENVKRSARLFRDLNGDGVLNDNEIDASLVLGVGVDEED